MSQVLLAIQNPENWEQQKESVRTAKETIPLIKARKHAWWNAECDEAIKERQQPVSYTQDVYKRQLLGGVQPANTHRQCPKC